LKLAYKQIKSEYVYLGVVLLSLTVPPQDWNSKELLECLCYPLLSICPASTCTLVIIIMFMPFSYITE